MENTKTIQYNGVFSKWFIKDKSGQFTPDSFASVLENMRIWSWVSSSRKWFITRINNWTATPIKWIWQHNQKLVFSYDSDVFITNNDITLATNIWTLNTWSFTTNYWPSFTSYWSNLMIFNWGVPQKYDWTTLSDITTIDSWYKPIMAEIFSNSQWISNWTATVIRSQPANSTSPNNIYVFNDASESVVKTVESPVVWIKNALSNLYIFCENHIYAFSNWYDSTTTPPAPIFQKIYEWQWAVNNNSITSSNSAVFFLTRENKIKTINYVPWVANSVVWELSNAEWNSIQGWIDENLHLDQSLANAYYFDVDQLIKFNVRSKTSSYNDLVIVYDIKNNTFIIDKGKSFWTKNISLKWLNFVGSSTTWKIFTDEYGSTDDWAAITSKRRLKEFTFWDPTIRKVLREMKISGKINLNTTINVNIYIDWTLESTHKIDKSIFSNEFLWIKTDNVLYNFRKSISKWELFEKWYIFEIEFTATWTDLNFVLEHINLTVGAIGDTLRNELFDK